VLDLSAVDSKESWKRVKRAFEEGYRKPDELCRREPEWPVYHEKDTPIRMVGVWDTVGALGVPDDLEILNLSFQ